MEMAFAQADCGWGWGWRGGWGWESEKEDWGAKEQKGLNGFELEATESQFRV